ncbi:hypothetical protein FEM48_Zijuj02G0112700 [Ziziphus jujuba var. spinosa]|uniref:Transcription factor Iwr1 domain-containing protein n=1 Tax=Ziziphus jujuba var. spinosa TaxID=714518 RepID=A0A978VVE9_ZIZJJ|nr:hypothetical protein FEM48_Zijuj02G0112700 [Ziziphus jujuba var. spinosa]
MAAVGESSSAPPEPSDDKPVVVRVKRKAFHSPLDGFWLEINERPLKRSILDFEKLSLSDSSKKEELKTRKVFVRHVETVRTTEITTDIVQSFVETNSAGAFESKTKREERRHTFKKENRHDQILSKSIQKQEAVAKNARFEQIWRSRKGKKEKLHKMCHFYDVVRVDVEERSNEVQEQEEALEEQRILASYLPLLREFIPSAAEEIESQAYKFKQDDFVYDYYTVKNEMDVADLDADASHPFPLVQVDEDDFYNGPAESEYESDDSNAENNPLNDYPDEISEEEEEEEEDEDEDADEESEASENELEENGRNRSSESIDIEDRRLSLDAQLLYEDDIYNYDDYEEDGFDYDDDDSGGNDVEY